MTAELYKVKGYNYEQGKSLFKFIQTNFPEFHPQRGYACEQYEDIFEFEMFGMLADMMAAEDLWASDIS